MANTTTLPTGADSTVATATTTAAGAISTAAAMSGTGPSPRKSSKDAAAAAAAAAAGAAAGSTEVWTSLLKSVASSRFVPTKDVIILGDPHSGKSTLIELLKTAQPTPAEDLDATSSSKNANGTNPGVGGGSAGGAGVNGSGTGNGGSAPVMVEMGTATSEDHHLFAGQKKNDLALSYSYWNVKDDENEDTVARLGLYQIAGSHKSYHELLKYCLSTRTVADSVIVLVLDWSRPWTFMETLQRWIKVLQIALQQICLEGAVAAATWTKGKALMDELQEKLIRFLQEYTEPQANPSLATSILNDDQSVLLPLTEGCLTDNTGLPIVIVCTKVRSVYSDHINHLERDMDFKEETFDYIQQSLRTICLKYGAGLFYTSIHHPHTFANLRQYLLHRLLGSPVSSSGPNAIHLNPNLASPLASFPFKKRAQVVERDQVMVPSGWDSFGKIKVLRPGFDCEGLVNGWESDQEAPSGGATEAEAKSSSPTVNASGARQVYQEVVKNPKLNHAPATIQPIITAEDDQVFLERFFETLQKAGERSGSSLNTSGGADGHLGLGLGSSPLAGVTSSGYSPLHSGHHHHSASPPPSSITATSRVNGFEHDDIESRLKRLTNKNSMSMASSATSPSTKINGGAAGSSYLGPSLSEGGAGAGAGAGGAPSANMSRFMTDYSRAMAGPQPGQHSGGMATAGSHMGRIPGATVPGVVPGAPGATSPASNDAVFQFFQSLITRSNPGAGGASPDKFQTLSDNSSNNNKKRCASL
ncbi:hypothetical protein BGW38_010773 [Lunasporangiospora selenospora]|uniref:Dynein light intermediate chain n=1 Tax=Lunasporangiospora selenospora TaxID=979761 RepID=A0A9P6G2A6_9FUNG|nr:hypothetical protein BGW38_010773 [Lunasporangiospora selenospora]